MKKVNIIRYQYPIPCFAQRGFWELPRTWYWLAWCRAAGRNSKRGAAPEWNYCSQADLRQSTRCGRHTSLSQSSWKRDFWRWGVENKTFKNGVILAEVTVNLKAILGTLNANQKMQFRLINLILFFKHWEETREPKGILPKHGTWHSGWNLEDSENVRQQYYLLPAPWWMFY